MMMRPQTSSSRRPPSGLLAPIFIIATAFAVVFSPLSSSSAQAFAPPYLTNAASHITSKQISTSSSPSTSRHRSSLNRNDDFRSTTTTALSAASPLFGLSTTKTKKHNKSPTYFAIPSLYPPDDSRPIVLFDGKCNLCNAGVQLVLDTDRADKDPRGNLRVAALQSRLGKVLLGRLSEEERRVVLGSYGGKPNEDNEKRAKKEYKSIVVMEKNRTYLNSAACLRIGRELRGPLRYLALLASLLPRFIRDPLYRLLSRYRKRLFGESAECRLWDDNWDTRFVDDAILGGKGASDDMDLFADPNAKEEEEREEEAEEEEEEEEEEAPAGSPILKEGDMARVVSSRPIVHTHVEGFEECGICTVGLVGRVKRVLKRQSFRKNVVVQFNVEKEGEIGDEKITFEAHFFPGQLRKE
mmetsp:Transcript_11862/g.24952  ORF Transcript_11862/g.24952 Transcript_11862/m.24952 type:complete len:411 (+) Transcript_11862:117-1349(+)